MGVTGIMFLGCPSFHPSSFHSCNNLKNVQRVHFVYAYADTMTCLDFGVMRLKVKLTVFNKIKNSYECIVLKITLEPRDWSTSTLAHVCTISEEGVSPSLILLSVNKSIGGGVGWWNFHISLYNFNLTFIRVLHYQCHNYKVHVPISGTFMNSSFVQKSTCSQRLFFFIHIVSLVLHGLVGLLVLLAIKYQKAWRGSFQKTYALADMQVACWYQHYTMLTQMSCLQCLNTADHDVHVLNETVQKTSGYLIGPGRWKSPVHLPDWTKHMAYKLKPQQGISMRLPHQHCCMQIIPSIFVMTMVVSIAPVLQCKA